MGNSKNKWHNMSPSRGSVTAASHETSTELKADARSSSALASAKTNFAYLFNPKGTTHVPAHLRTRALLRTLRYVGIFIFWRIVRYAKYALVGTLVAAVGATAFGSVISGAAFVVAPPSIAASVGIGLIWSVGKWGFRKMGVGRKVQEGGVREVQRSDMAVKQDGTWRDVQGPHAAPW
jgi:hypothetical protein